MSNEQKATTAIIPYDGVVVDQIKHELKLRRSNAVSPLVPKNLGEVMEFAKFYAGSDLAAPGYKGNPGNTMIAMLMAMELRLPPFIAMQNISVINGRAAVWGDVMLAICQAAPTCIDIIEDDLAVITKTGMGRCLIKRHGKQDLERTFSIDQAKKAGLWGKSGPWQQYPERMLQMRARGFACRDAFAAELRGLGMIEEVRDIEPLDVRASLPGSPDPKPAEVVSASSLPPRKQAARDRIKGVVEAQRTEEEPVEVGHVLALIATADSARELLDVWRSHAKRVAQDDLPQLEEAYKTRRMEIKERDDAVKTEAAMEGESES